MNDPQRELEHLRKLATVDSRKRFDKLLKMVRQEGLLTLAWQRVHTNQGSVTPGIDGQTRKDIDSQTIGVLAEELKANRYQPQPVRRAYIPKGKHQKRPLGIPTLRDRIVQAGVMMILEAIYEPLFRNCSYGFRPQRSTIHALRHVAVAYRAGATWVIEGDLEKCFDSLPHGVILNCLRKRIKDERFIDLIRRMLCAGVMEMGRQSPTYSGTPQGGIVSPILANIVLHEFDCWMEDHQQANPPAQTREQLKTRINPDYRRLNVNIQRWRAQLQGTLPRRRQTPEQLQQKLAAALVQRSQTPTYLPRRAIFYCRYADDYVVVLCNYAKAEAQQLKETMASWLQQNLGLKQHPQKTAITHWRKTFRFLGYNLRGQGNASGTRWLRLTIPSEAERQLKQRVKRLCGYYQIPAVDLFLSVNALLRGWTQYYRYAHNAKRRMGYLTGMVFWLTAHYLGRQQRCSIKKIMRNHYARDPQTGHQALYITLPDGRRLFLWNKRPAWRSVLSSQLNVQDQQPLVRTAWARGHSHEQRLALLQQHQHRCDDCGRTDDPLVVHHTKRLSKKTGRKQDTAYIIQSAQEQRVKLLCQDCHIRHHHGHWRMAK